MLSLDLPYQQLEDELSWKGGVVLWQVEPVQGPRGTVLWQVDPVQGPRGTVPREQCRE